MLTFFEFLILALVAADAVGHLSSYTPPTPKWRPWVWIAIIVATYAAELSVMVWTARNQLVPTWHLALPILVVDDRGYHTNNADLVCAAMLIVAAVQSYALLALYRAKVHRIALLAGFAALISLSFAAPALISFDMYGYVYNDLRGFDSYVPTNVPQIGEFHLIDLWYGGAAHGGAYGPLFLAIVQVVMTAVPTLLGKLLVWRGYCAVLYLALLFALRACRLPDRVIAVAALNPGLMLQFVVNGHNDLTAIVIVVFGAAWMKRQPVAGYASIVLAAALKIPYLALASPITATVRPLFWRIGGLLLAAATTIAIYLLLGGRGNSGALSTYAPNPSNVVPTVAVLAALVLLTLGVFHKRRLRSAPWLMPLLSPVPFSWYLIWGLPYALGRRRLLSYLLVAFPFANMLFESAFIQLWKIYYVLPVVIAAAIFMPNSRLRLPERERRGSFRSRQKKKLKKP